MKRIIGIVGENGSGKDTFTTFFTAAVAPLSVSKMRFSDVLSDTLSMWDIPPSRSNLQNLAIIMDETYGTGSLTHASKMRITNTQSDFIILEGIRWDQDVPMIRSFPNSTVLYITSDANTRFERMKLRKEKPGEENLTKERFLIEEKAKTEIHITKIGKNADYKIENNGSIEEFRQKVEEFYEFISKNR